MKILEITPLIGCKNNCHYCPQDKLLKAYTGKKVMSFEEFKIMMKNVPRDVRISFAGFVEPFLNPESSLMMKWCIENHYYTALYTTLVGFSENDANILKGLTFDSVNFHEFPHVNKETYINKGNLFKNTIGSKNKYGNITVGHGGTTLWSRGGNLFDVKVVNNPVYCGPDEGHWDHNVSLPNGDVVLCCMDYGLKHVIGNLFTTHYDELDRSKIQTLANKESSDLLCRTCELVKSKYAINVGGIRII